MNRDVLRGEAEASRPHQMKRRLRERVYDGLRVDGPLLLHHLNPAERRSLFRAWEQDWGDDESIDAKAGYATSEMLIHGADPELRHEREEVERGNFREAIVDLLAFLYLGVEEGNVGDFDEMLGSALGRAARESDRELKEFDLSYEMPGVAVRRPQTIAKKVRQGDGDVTYRELNLAIEEGALDPTHPEAREMIEILEQLSDVTADADDSGE